MSTDKIDATKVHSLTQKSKTLYRHATQKPASQNTPQPRKIGRSMDIARSNRITHFTPHVIAKPAKPTVITKPQLDVSPTRHPLAVKVAAIRASAPVHPAHIQPAIAQKTAKTIKEEAIAEAFNQLEAEKAKEIENSRKQSKIIRLISYLIGLIVIIVIGLFIYLNIPSLSVSIASAQSGINASYPNYHPDGYSPNGPVSFSDGQVTVGFHANTGNGKYDIIQKKSSWDSSAVKNQVAKDAGNAVVSTFEESGLSIYTYTNNGGGSASWVNGGIMYTINSSSEAPLSVDQIRRIATSL